MKEIKKNKVPELSKKQINESIESNKKSIQNIEKSLLDTSKSIEKLNKLIPIIKKLENQLNSYTNRFFAEIRVLPEGHNPDLQGGSDKIKSKNGWEDYSGSFYLEPGEREQIVIDRARNHCRTYFEDAIYHRNKKLGIFVSGGGISGKKLIEIIETGE
tara:strand:- start:882 stop:1355 length:474 start_codon:yes stop_codon:yes gene_type:complete